MTEPSRWSTLARFLARTFQPTSHWVFGGVGVLASVGVPLAFDWGDPRVTAIAALAVMVALVAWAGYGAQRELDLNSAPRFTVTTEDPEPVPASLPFLLSGDYSRHWTEQMILRVRVRNEGPTARFAARVDHVAPVYPLDSLLKPGNQQEIGPIAWEDTLERECRIVRGEFAHLKLATDATWGLPDATKIRARILEDDPGPEGGRAFWFWRPRSVNNPDAHGIAPRLIPGAATVHFNLTVVNLNEDTNQTLRLAIRFDAKTNEVIDLRPSDE